MKRLTILMIACALAVLNAATAATVTVQPKIMVVPFVKEGEDIRTVLESDADKRIILTKIKEAFDSRGFTTVDFLGKLKAASTQGAMASSNSRI